MIKKLVIIAVIAAVLYGQSARAASVMEPKTMQEFKSQVGGGKVILFLGSNGCPHCRAFMPKFRAVAAGSNAKFIFADYATPQLIDLTHEYRTQSPVVIVLNNGVEVKRIPASGLNQQTLQAAVQ